jgi:hypothetical protein
MRDVKGANGVIVARVDGAGNVMMGTEAGPVVGRVNNSGEIYDDDAGVHQVGRVEGDGTVVTMQYEPIAKVDSWGRVQAPDGELLGTVEKPCDAGALVFLTGLVTIPQVAAPKAEDTSLMAEALDLGEQDFPGVRKDYKPLTDRDLFTERLRRD